MIDFYASRSHYRDHLLPIWEAIDDRHRGFFHDVPPLRSDRLTVVAGGSDLAGLRRAVLVEHGAGQTYVEVDHEGWSGGPRRDRVELFVVPNLHAARANRTRYPTTPFVVCSPRVEYLRTLDQHVAYDVVFGRHWDSYLTAELNSAWPHHFETIRDYCLTHPRTALHFHPRCAEVGQTLANDWGIRYIDSFDEVVRTCDTLVVDNSSVGFEWAALGRKVVWLNAPHYRRKLEQGLRFWSHVDVGVECDDPDGLEAALDAPFTPRQDLVQDVYPLIEGAAKVAAEAIIHTA